MKAQRVKNLFAKDPKSVQTKSFWNIPFKNEYYYACKPHGRYLRNVVDGCVEPNSGAKVTIGERVEKGDYV